MLVLLCQIRNDIRQNHPGYTIRQFHLYRDIRRAFEAEQASYRFQSQRIVVLRPSPETHGNASRIGAAYMIAQAAFEEIDFVSRPVVRPLFQAPAGRYISALQLL